MKQIILSNNKITLVDDEDFEFLMNFKWHCRDKQRRTLYAYSSTNTYSTLTQRTSSFAMHRLILNVTDSNIKVDHIDCNGLNNQKSNLRLCSSSENSRNRGFNKNNVSGYKGVYWSKNRKKWIANIRFDGKVKNLGGYKDIIDAAVAYNNAAIKYFGDFANLNEIKKRKT